MKFLYFDSSAAKHGGNGSSIIIKIIHLRPQSSTVVVYTTVELWGF